MVKIRYSELPAGLHVVAEADRRHTIVYLLPGLTPAQRRAALMRVRNIARMGHGPTMPVLSMALAVAADRVCTTTRNGAAALRRHPMVFLLPLIAVVASAIVFMLMSFVTLTVGPSGKAVAAVPTLGIDSGQSGTHAHGSAGQAGQGKAGLSRPRRSRRHAPPASPSASASGLTVFPPQVSGPSSQVTEPSAGLTHASPSGSSSPRASSPRAPSTGSRCINLGPLRFCVRA